MIAAGTGRYDRRGFTLGQSGRIFISLPIYTLIRVSRLNRLSSRSDAFLIFCCQPFELSSVSLEDNRDALATPRMSSTCRTRQQWLDSPDMRRLSAWIADPAFLIWSPCRIHLAAVAGWRTNYFSGGGMSPEGRPLSVLLNRTVAHSSAAIVVPGPTLHAHCLRRPQIENWQSWVQFVKAKESARITTGTSKVTSGPRSGQQTLVVGAIRH